MSTWVPKVISLAATYRSGQVPTAQEINELFNLLITQGNWNTDLLVTLANTDLPALKESINVISAAVTGDANTSLIELVTKVTEFTTAYETVLATMVSNTDGEIKNSLTVGLNPVPNASAFFEIAGGASAEAPKTYMSVDPTNGIKVLMNGVLKTLLDAQHPVGSLYLSVDGTVSPATLFGGTWEMLGEGQMLMTANPNGVLYKTSGMTGGSPTTTLTVDNVPKHSHSFSTKATPTGSVATTVKNTAVDPHFHWSGTLAADTTQITGRIGNLVVEKVGGLLASGAFSPELSENTARYGGGTEDVRAADIANLNVSHAHTVSGGTALEGAHNHNASATSTFTGVEMTISGTTTLEAGTAKAFNTLSPYTTVFAWKRTA